MTSLLRTAGLTYVLIALAPPPAIAAPLEPAACQQLRQELSALDASGARASLERGAGWAKANLQPQQLEQIERLLEVQGQFLFRCPQPKRKLDPATEALMEHGTGSDPDPDAKPADAAAAPKTAVAKPKRTPPKPKPADALTPTTPPARSAGNPPSTPTSQ